MTLSLIEINTLPDLPELVCILYYGRTRVSKKSSLIDRLIAQAFERYGA